MTAADILASRHLAPDCPSVDLRDFAAEPFILLRSGNNLHDRAMHFFHQAGIEPAVKMELSQMATAYRLAAPESRRSFYALTNPKRYTSEAVHQFIGLMPQASAI